MPLADEFRIERIDSQVTSHYQELMSHPRKSHSFFLLSRIILCELIRTGVVPGRSHPKEQEVPFPNG
jgi:acetolactate synthase small subunit